MNWSLWNEWLCVSNVRWFDLGLPFCSMKFEFNSWKLDHKWSWVHSFFCDFFNCESRIQTFCSQLYIRFLFRIQFKHSGSNWLQIFLLLRSLALVARNAANLKLINWTTASFKSVEKLRTSGEWRTIEKTTKNDKLEWLTMKDSRCHLKYSLELLLKDHVAWIFARINLVQILKHLITNLRCTHDLLKSEKWRRLMIAIWTVHTFSLMIFGE
jgi:hypothetical protein